MTAPTSSELRALSQSTSPFVTGANSIPPPTAFLSLAPTTSASYPKERISASPPRSVTGSAVVPAAPKANDPIVAAAAVESTDMGSAELIAAAIAKQRRSSSMGSTGSEGSVGGQRFLKLGPAYWGENQDGKGDWAEDE